MSAVNKHKPSAPASNDDLTAREQEVMRLIAVGLSDAQIAEKLVVSVRTVHAHLRSIYNKFDSAAIKVTSPTPHPTSSTFILGAMPASSSKHRYFL